MRLEYNFSNQHLEMIEDTNGDQFVNDFTPVPHDSSGLMGEQTGDYIRMSVLNEDGSFIRSFYSNLSVDDEEVIYTSAGDTAVGLNPDTVVIANPRGADFGLDPYPIYAEDESLDQYCVEMNYGVHSNPISTTADTYYQWHSREAIAHWPLNEGADYTVTDIVGGITGDMVGSTTWVDDPERGMVIHVDNNVHDPPATSYVVGTPTGLPVDDQSRTIAGWVKPDGAGADGKGVMFGYDNEGVEQSQFEFWQGPAVHDGLYIHIQNGNIYPETPFFLPAGVWTHLVATYDGSTVSMYRDGVFVPLSNSSGYGYEGVTLVGANNAQFRMGATSSGNPNAAHGPWKGHISDVAIWDYALLESEIDELIAYGFGWTLEQGTADVAASVECSIAPVTPDPYTVDWITNPNPQLRIYKATGIVGETNNIFVKPNEVLEARDFEAGNYQLMFEFLHNPFEIVGDDPTDKTYFFITEISSSRKEVRLIARDTVNAQLSITKDDIDGAMQPYRYDFVLGLPAGQNIPILNYMIDTVSNPTWSSLILKLYSAVPSSITNLTQVTIEREIFTTQTEDIWYKTEDYIGPSTGIGLGQQSGFLSYEDAS